MSVIAVQAGYGQYVIDTQPGDARAALGAIQATSREALDEMRRMLGALRQADEGDVRPAGSIRGRFRGGADAGRCRGPGARPRLRPGRACRCPPRPGWPTWTGCWPAPRARASGWT